ncbi:MAG: RNA pyrophosphohydrolase [Sphingomonas sp.]
MNEPGKLPYRPCAGIMIMNAQGQIFVGQRVDTKVEAWQLPQGGIDPGETAHDAAFRELAEETGISADKVALLATSAEEYYYDLPDDLIGKVWRGKWRGQRQRWFLFRFLGSDGDVNIATEHQEFSAWRWVAPAEIISLAVPFKRTLYANVLAAFSDHLLPGFGARE